MLQVKTKGPIVFYKPSLLLSYESCESININIIVIYILEYK